ncbi:nuclear transport factor 2 family protein [Natronococcus sp. A-GB7]|uniref:nuclear transport factor 2 family protein n=1 Tax=Natronococcus sp. A-GB7 TaxID=3037649 RepID=UPI00241E03F1|nr:nuclear transport factor 2 family protein [Natronococcus sp. A-GB7]MDG5819126.1 nuclear transport factor 2 family protein [Natronococcus sp. A-GB7]
MDAVALVERYYESLDAHEYDALEDVLAPEFVQQRPDRRFEDREAFVEFMREDRPNKRTRHDLEDVLADGGRVAVRGRVVDDETGSALFEFADVFELGDGRIVRLETYSR